MTFFDIERILQPIKRKIFLVIGRAILTAIDNSEGTQKVQVTGLDGETITGIERFQEYGFESYPKKDAEVVIGFINGNRDQGIALKVHDRTYRPTDLVEGEARVYNFDGNTRVSVKEGLIEITAGGTLEKSALGETLKSTLESLIDAINALTVTCAGPGNPSSTPINAATFTAIKTGLSSILSDEVKIS